METSENNVPNHETPSSVSIHDIPEWFLAQILYRLPSKHLIRCKCVSKQFLSLISDPAFVRSYISLASTSSKPRPWTLIMRVMHTRGAMYDVHNWDHEQMLIRLEQNLDSSLLMNNYASPLISKLVTRKKKASVVAMSNGLFLCRWEWVNYAILNPITKQSILLPGPGWLKEVAMGFQTHADQVGVVSYKVARFWSMNWDVPETDHEVEELSSETNVWEPHTVQFPEPILCSNFLGTAFSFKGVFHWFDACSDDGTGCIISYDPVRIIRSPGRGRIIWCGEIVGTGRDQHTIRCIKQDNKGFIHLWRMEDYDQGTWNLDLKFAISEILLPSTDYNNLVPCREVTIITFHPSEPDLLYFWGRAEQQEWIFVSFNVLRRNSRVSDTIPNAHGNFEDIRRMFLDTPFVLPPWPALLPDRSQ